MPRALAGMPARKLGAGLRTAYVAEPPPQFLQRPPAVVDCSLLCAFHFDEPEAADAERLMAGRRLCAPRLLDQEVLNVAVTKLKRGMPRESVERAFADYLEQPIDLADPALDEQFLLATRYGLSGYDAAYLWLAAELRAPLLTFDRKLGAAAQAHLQGLG